MKPHLAFACLLLLCADLHAAEAAPVAAPDISNQAYNAAAALMREGKSAEAEKAAQALVAAIHARQVQYAASPDAAIAQAIARAREGDAILTLGAGNVSQLAPLAVERLRAQ